MSITMFAVRFKKYNNYLIGFDGFLSGFAFCNLTTATLELSALPATSTLVYSAMVVLRNGKLLTCVEEVEVEI